MNEPLVKRRALQRILETPHLARLVPQLRPEVLHRVIQTCGLEDCGDLLALVTPAQLRQLGDLDLWRPERPGRTETFDAARFGVWLDVLVETSPSVAARRLAELDREVVTTGFAQHIRVFDRATLAGYVTTDGDVIPDRSPQVRLTAELGGYVIIARRPEAWDAIGAALTCLETDQPSCFRDVMSAVRALSNSTPERDGLDDLLDVGDQLMYDARIDRERRRERQGYVAVGDARAFLQASRNSRVEVLPTQPGPTLAQHAVGGEVPAGENADAAAPLVTVLREAGIIEQFPTALLAESQTSPHLRRMRDQMQWLIDRAPRTYAARNADLAVLANTLAAGCSIQGRAFSAEEAWDAAVATCNLGLESLGAPEGFLADHDLIGAFQAGWTILHDDVVMYAAAELAEVLRRLRCVDRVIQADIDALRHDLATSLRTGTPWQARARMDVLASLDTPAWVALLDLIAEYPVRHAVIRAARSRTTHAVGASAFEFISEAAALREIRAYLQSLPELISS